MGTIGGTENQHKDEKQLEIETPNQDMDNKQLDNETATAMMTVVGVAAVVPLRAALVVAGSEESGGRVKEGVGRTPAGVGGGTGGSRR